MVSLQAGGTGLAAYFLSYFDQGRVLPYASRGTRQVGATTVALFF